jgi:serine/threonine protein kinase
MSLNEKAENSDFFSTEFPEESEGDELIPGGNGVFELYKCLHHRKWVIRKQIKPDKALHPAWRESLIREFETGYQMVHPNLLQYYHLETQPENRLYVLREWVDGETLGEWTRRPHSQAVKLKVLRQLLEALAYLHRHQLYHRDLSPSNVMITHRSNQVKIMDFGFSAGESDLILAAGTPAWSAPEQLQGALPGPQGDLYSIGKLAGLIFPKGEQPKQVALLIQACLEPDPLSRPPSAELALELLNAKTPNIGKRWLTGGLALGLALLVFWGIKGIRQDKPIEDTPKPILHKQDGIGNSENRQDSTPRLVGAIPPASSKIEASGLAIGVKDEDLQKVARGLGQDLILCYDSCVSGLPETRPGRYRSGCLSCFYACEQSILEVLTGMQKRKVYKDGELVLISRYYGETSGQISDSIRGALLTSRTKRK